MATYCCRRPWVGVLAIRTAEELMASGTRIAEQLARQQPYLALRLGSGNRSLDELDGDAAGLRAKTES
jgi:hypothetical protein